MNRRHRLREPRSVGDPGGAGGRSLVVALACALALPACKSERAPGETASDTPPAPAGAKGRNADTANAKSDDVDTRALAKRLIIVDGHVDLPYRLVSLAEDAARSADPGRPGGEPAKDPAPAAPAPADLIASIDPAVVVSGIEGGDFDHPRAALGGLDAPFMSIYVPAKHQTEGGAKALADRLIDLVEAIARAAPDKLAIARSPADVERHHAAGVISLPMGIENGAALEGDLANVAHFHGRGVRYITLTHSKDNDICDSSYDETRTHKGLSAFGRQVVAEMNRVGIMIDISHVSDDAARQVLALTRAPVIASHSSARKFVPGFERNLPDDLIRALAKNGGVVLINFGSTFVRADANAQSEARRDAIEAFAAERELARDDPAVKAFGDEWRKTHGFSRATISDVADHIDHVAELAGVDHVGFGSDFDGVGDTLPTGLEDVSKYPALIAELLRRGYSEEDLAKICGGNALRVWRAVEAAASR